MNSQTLKKPLLQRPRKKVVLKICWNPQPHVLLSSWSNLQTFRSSKKTIFTEIEFLCQSSWALSVVRHTKFLRGVLSFRKKTQKLEKFVSWGVRGGTGQIPLPPPVPYILLLPQNRLKIFLNPNFESASLFRCRAYSDLRAQVPFWVSVLVETGVTEIQKRPPEVGVIP